MTIEAQPVEGAAAPAVQPQPVPAAPVATPAPQAPTPAPAPVAPVAAEPPKPHVPASALPEDALKARLEQAKVTGQTDLLKSLGVANVDELKVAIEAKRVAEEAKRSDAEKLAARDKELQALRQQVETQEQVNAQLWASQSAGLTPVQLKSVTDIAGANPSACLKALHALLPSWQSAAAAAPTTPQPAPAAATPPTPPAPATQPANTSPSPAAPPPTGTTTQTDHTAVWKSLKESNPVAAAQYLLAHQSSIQTR